MRIGILRCMQQVNMRKNIEFRMSLFLLLIMTAYQFALTFGQQSATMFEFEDIQFSKTFPGASVVEEAGSISKIHCAAKCCLNPSCKAMSFDCTSYDQTGFGNCILLSDYVTDFAQLVNSDMCYIQRKIDGVSLLSSSASPPTTQAATVLPTATSSFLSSVIELMTGTDLCPGTGSSQQDLVLLTSAGVYVYDAFEDMFSTGPCMGPTDFIDMFPGYSQLSSSDIDNVGAAFVFQNIAEIYMNDGYVYRWNLESGRYNKLSNVRSSFADHLGALFANEVGSTYIQWGVWRSSPSSMYHFFMTDDKYILKEGLIGVQTHTSYDQVLVNSMNVNPWSNIPPGIVAVSGYSSEPSKHFAFVQNTNKVYRYELDSSDGNHNDPVPIVTEMGNLVLG